MLTELSTTDDSPLAEFVREYAEAVGGVWDEVEPNVYDLLLPAGELGHDFPLSSDGVVRLAFDPEAIPEHPGSQLASLGTPLIDRLLSAATTRGQFARAYFTGLPPAPFDLPRKLQRAIQLPAAVQWDIQRTRTLLAAQAIYWFEVTFESDQKEQEVLAIGLDLRTGREVRHLDRLLDFSRLGQEPSDVRVEARRLSAAAAYSQARDQALRTLSTLANVRRRELAHRVERQSARMSQYFHDLAEELKQQKEKAAKRGDDTAKVDSRLDALARESRLRIGELRQKHALKICLRLLSLLLIEQPKVICTARLTSADAKAPSTALDLCWDPLLESVEAVDCPNCRAPTYQLEHDPRKHICCPACKSRGK